MVIKTTVAIPSSNGSHHPEMSEQIFFRLAERICDHSGIVFSLRKRQLVETRLRKRLQALGLDNFEAYITYLDSHAGGAEIGEMINVITTILTSFFRENHHFTDMARVLTSNSEISKKNRRIRICSAACSTGEEPYSIGISVLEAGLVVPGVDLRILATDLDTNALNRAKSAIFPVERLKSCPTEFHRRYFDTLSDGQLQIKNSVRNLIQFNQMNLHDQWPVRGPFDVIFCRNVLIYFGDAEKKSIAGRFVSLLRPGGTLYLGHSESMLGTHPELIRQGRTIFRRKS